MATVLWQSCLFFYLFSQATALGILDTFVSDTDSCEEVCHNTYPLHTYEQGDHLAYCQRGCRLFSILDSLNFCDLNATKYSCIEACHEAHDVDEDANACIVGCNSQVISIEKMHNQFKQFMDSDDAFSPLYPFLYVHNWYSNMIDKISSQVSVSWSFYMRGDNNEVVILQSVPEFVVEPETVRFGDDEVDDDYKTSNYMETNLASVDNSATPNFKHLQVHPIVERDFAGMDLPVNMLNDEAANDWLSCISKKTGLPRLLLSFTIFLSAVVMIWLCFTTAATAPDQHVRSAPPQKLSIYGDLEFLPQVEEDSLLAKVHCQGGDPSIQPLPLPIKVKVERI